MVGWIITVLSLDLKTFPIIRHTTDLIRFPWEKERSTTVMYMSIVRHIPISKQCFENEKKKEYIAKLRKYGM